ncbi:GNAT family N-acetyltransferase [Lysinibacillus sp. SGAir0095]|uniref:GNAT family N-acetyltransferase n=1 Tax=Lysinibacillus sp. SGAir0095 TaxID=2070463 RepID=UPI0010CD34E4|nr:GNAT family N-acetyltransferase [Lysinibacillus sp. SGAir0095]QCR32304.1 N-acetyltransferase [Lysinibacillus sp. SGAir0095]
MSILMRTVTKNDWEQVKTIYEAGIATKNATFETEAPSSFDQWYGNAIASCTFVAEEDAIILGWCKLTPVSYRKVYSGVGELSIYVHPDAKGKGVGNLLLHHLIKHSEAEGFWTLESKIFCENEASIQLHKKNGFKIVGIREKIGKQDGIWRDILLLERRSDLVGWD